MMSIPARGLFAVVLLCTPPGFAQSFNINATGYPGDPVPSSSHGAGANQPGYWNAGALVATTPLVDTGGNSTAADISFGGCCLQYEIGACLNGDDATLMGFVLFYCFMHSAVFKM